MYSLFIQNAKNFLQGFFQYNIPVYIRYERKVGGYLKLVLIKNTRMYRTISVIFLCKLIFEMLYYLLLNGHSCLMGFPNTILITRRRRVINRVFVKTHQT